MAAKGRLPQTGPCVCFHMSPCVHMAGTQGGPHSQELREAGQGLPITAGSEP